MATDQSWDLVDHPCRQMSLPPGWRFGWVLASTLLVGKSTATGDDFPQTIPERCDVSKSNRRFWTDNALVNLTNNGYKVGRGSIVFAPFGTISNPAGTYGAIIFDDLEDAYPGGTDFCSCLAGNTSISPVCSLLETPLASSSTEADCKGCGHNNKMRIKQPHCYSTNMY